MSETVSQEPLAETPGYRLSESPPTASAFVALRDAAGMGSRSLEAVERGLPNSVYAAHVVHEDSGETVGMGRIVGDDGAVYHISDMAVHPDHQGQGLGTAIMDVLWHYIETTAPETAYVNLVADVDGFYERWGFEPVQPTSRGLAIRLEE
ncbi:GNAT family N-acetyltransferase [Halobacteria archaeon AArc-curdl1]|uniref:GNAT family N-acetyltransferase n=1 Tax=Natronosalvus hydrolyticus TaxID=2979988 RepID=A0AAP2Z8N2_9EURY|nr:GNAT family N-acetyltransferase [Halobacteria archaeon AArc-curdl1]